MRTDRPRRREARRHEWAKHLRPEGKRSAAKRLRQIRKRDAAMMQSSNGQETRLSTYGAKR